MNTINPGGESEHVNEYVSPYSILRASDAGEVDSTIQKITAGCGPRGNRA